MPQIVHYELPAREIRKNDVIREYHADETLTIDTTGNLTVVDKDVKTKYVYLHVHLYHADDDVLHRMQTPLDVIFHVWRTEETEDELKAKTERYLERKFEGEFAAAIDAVTLAKEKMREALDDTRTYHSRDLDFWYGTAMTRLVTAEARLAIWHEVNDVRTSDTYPDITTWVAAVRKVRERKIVELYEVGELYRGESRNTSQMCNLLNDVTREVTAIWVSHLSWRLDAI